VLSGTVVTDDSAPRPVRRARVQLRSSDAAFVGGLEAITDDSGVFRFTELAAARYYLTASKPGMVTAAYGARRPQGQGSSIALADGQTLTGVTLKVLKGAVIAGTIRDASGEPLSGVRVVVMRYGFAYQTGDRQLQRVVAGLGEETDDRGQYRLYGLPPGEYKVVATVGLGSSRGSDDVQMTSSDVQWAMRQIQDATRTMASAAPPAASSVSYAPVFYPGTASEAGSGTIALAAGEERAGVDFPLVRVPTSKIAGAITSADGVVPPNLQVNFIAHQRIAGLPFSGFGSVPQVRDGRFTIGGVLPGTYTITVRPRAGPPAARGGPPSGGAPTDLYAMEEVTVSGADVAVTLRLRAGVTVSGRVAFDGSAVPPSDLTRTRVSLTAVLTGGGVALGVSPGTVDASGTFSFRGVTPGRYRVVASVPGGSPGAGWLPRSAILGGRDALDFPIDVGTSDIEDLVVTFTDRPAELSGTIQDASGQPAPEHFVILFTRDKAFWMPQSRRIQSARPGNDGRFLFRNLPPGEYRLAALTDVEQGQWYDPAFLEQLVPGAIAITIGEGEKKTQDIRIAGLDAALRRTRLDRR
jgi:hypothetical protein